MWLSKVTQRSVSPLEPTVPGDDDSVQERQPMPYENDKYESVKNYPKHKKSRESLDTRDEPRHLVERSSTNQSTPRQDHTMERISCMESHLNFSKMTRDHLREVASRGDCHRAKLFWPRGMWQSDLHGAAGTYN